MERSNRSSSFPRTRRSASLPASGASSSSRAVAFREGDWKLVVNGRNTEPDEKVFLSNLAESVTETENQAKANPEIVERLTTLHEEWLKDLER